jgi:dTMP kinase
LHRIALRDFAPDLTIILDLPVKDGLARAGRRSIIADRFEQLDHEFHRRLRDGFLAIAKAEPGRCVVVDATTDVATVQAAVLAAVAERLGVRFG